MASILCVKNVVFDERSKYEADSQNDTNLVLDVLDSSSEILLNLRTLHRGFRFLSEILIIFLDVEFENLLKIVIF